MPTVSEIACEIVRREGGFVNDPDLPGGATHWGVTLHTMRRLGLDLTTDGHIAADDLRKLTRDQAIDIFLRQYFEGTGIARLPGSLQASVFDMYVNAGANGVKTLQRLLSDMGWTVDVDGVIGPQTRAAAEMAADAAPEHLADAYAIARRNYYLRLADKRPASRKFARAPGGGKGGWIRRAEAFMSARYHMTPSEFADRVAAWR